MDFEATEGLGRQEEDPVVLRARRGEPGAFETLIRNHERQVFAIAWRLLGDAAGAEDAAQEVFLKLFQHLHQLDPSRPLAAWLYRVTTNVCHTKTRRRRTRPSVSLGDDAERVVGRSDAAAAAERREEHDMVAAGLASLPHKERAALVLHDIEGLSTREVAEILEVTEGTVRTHLCRGRLKMRSFRQRWYRRTPR